MPRKRTRRRHVALLIESSRGYGRGLIEGVERYRREQDTWSIYFEPRGLEGPPPWLARWKGDGILARLPNPLAARAVEAKGVPVVELYATAHPAQRPMVACDNEALAKLGFDHLWDGGLRRFACCGLSAQENAYMAERGEAFRRLAEAAGCPCSVFSGRSAGFMVSDWKREQDSIAAWLKGLKKPVGVLACFDERGFQVLSACAEARLKVPEQVAVISTGNDALLCALTTPPLSGIDQDSPRIGYEAAALLDRLMRGEAPPAEPIRIQPKGLVARRSTDVMAFPDRDVAAALRFMRDRACEGIRVDDVVNRLGVSYSLLERKFRHFLGRTPKAELQRVQIALARQLLVESDLPLEEVAQRCGFSNEKYFGNAFSRQVGIRPGAYRRQRGVTDGPAR